MKLTALMLATYISLLTIQPVAEQLYSSLTNHKEVCTMACCKHKQAMNNKQFPNNCCNKGICNPFGMCNCCFVYNQKETTIAYNNFIQTNKLIAAAENNFVSSFMSDCFHPPEIA